MGNVFISYVKEDALAAQRVVKALKSSEFSVWWDRSIPPGKTWDDVIGRALDAAVCVIVLWSRRSVQSRWVREEAERAASRGCLIPALLEKVEPPLGFQRIQCADFSEWSGDERAPEFVDLLAAVSDLVSTTAPADEITSDEAGMARPAGARALVDALRKEQGTSQSRFSECPGNVFWLGHDLARAIRMAMYEPANRDELDKELRQALHHLDEIGLPAQRARHLILASLKIHRAGNSLSDRQRDEFVSTIAKAKNEIGSIIQTLQPGFRGYPTIEQESRLDQEVQDTEPSLRQASQTPKAV